MYSYSFRLNTSNTKYSATRRKPANINACEIMIPSSTKNTPNTTMSFRRTPVIFFCFLFTCCISFAPCIGCYHPFSVWIS